MCAHFEHVFSLFCSKYENNQWQRANCQKHMCCALKIASTFWTFIGLQPEKRINAKILWGKFPKKIQMSALYPFGYNL